jgi:hypothetical protein
LKWQVSGHGLVGVVGAKQGCGCPIKMTWYEGAPAVGRELKTLVENISAVRMFIASCSGLKLDGDPCVLDPGIGVRGVAKFPWVLWLIPGNLARISAAQVRELEAAGYGPEQQKRHQDFLRQELYTQYPEFVPKRKHAEKARKFRAVPSGRRRFLGG